jgi:hypothetical protein
MRGGNLRGSGASAALVGAMLLNGYGLSVD